MNRQEVMEATFPIAHDLPKLAAKPDTILAEVLGTLRNAEQMGMDKAVDPENFSEFTAEIDKRYENENDEMLNAAAGRYADAMLATIDLATTLVNPSVVAAAQAAQASVNARANEYAADTVVIETMPSEDVWRAGALYQAVEPYSSDPVKEFNTRKLFEGDEDFPVEAFLTSIPSASIASELRETLASIPGGDAFLARVFYTFFCNSEGDTYSTAMGYFEQHERPLVNLLLLCMARALAAPTAPFIGAVTPSHGEERSSQLVGEYVTALVTDMSARVFNDLTKKIRDEKAGRSSVVYVTRTAPNTKGYIRVAVVERKAYNAALDDGLTPEMVLGSAVTQRYTTLEEIKDNGAGLVSAWQRYDSTVRRTRDIQKTVVIRECLVNAVMAEIMQMDDTVLTVSADEYQKIIEDKVSSLDPNDVGEYINVVRCLLCETVFAETDVQFFLEAMDEIGHDNPGMPTREITRLAAERTIACALADQIVAVE